MASAVRSSSVNGTLFLAMELAKFLFALDRGLAIPLRNNVLARRRGGPRPLDGPPALTGLAGTADVPALVSCP